MSQDQAREFVTNALAPSQRLARARLPKKAKPAFDRRCGRAIEELTQLLTAPKPRGPVVSIDNLIPQ